jgi:hypothetical protein
MTAGLSSIRAGAMDTLVDGKPRRIECIDILGQRYALRRGIVNILELEDEWYEDVTSPSQVLTALKSHSRIGGDIFSFWQRPPDSTPAHPYNFDLVDTAVLPIESYAQWWDKKIKPRVRNLVRKSQKDGLVVRETRFDDAFVKGMTAIFNESPVRQGRKFWHYGKDFETVKQQFSRFIHREIMIGAYHHEELVGLIMMGNAGKFGLTGQIISSLKHRDKFPNNALIAKAVEICAQRGIPNLCYLYWSDDSLSEFKRRCGFEKISVPRYYIPLTQWGSVAMRLGLHRGVRSLLPHGLKQRLKAVRNRWNSRLAGGE